MGRGVLVIEDDELQRLALKAGVLDPEMAHALSMIVKWDYCLTAENLHQILSLRDDIRILDVRVYGDMPGLPRGRLFFLLLEADDILGYEGVGVKLPGEVSGQYGLRGH